MGLRTELSRIESVLLHFRCIGVYTHRGGYSVPPEGAAETPDAEPRSTSSTPMAKVWREGTQLTC